MVAVQGVCGCVLRGIGCRGVEQAQRRMHPSRYSAPITLAAFNGAVQLLSSRCVCTSSPPCTEVLEASQYISASQRKAYCILPYATLTPMEVFFPPITKQEYCGGARASIHIAYSVQYSDRIRRVGSVIGRDRSHYPSPIAWDIPGTDIFSLKKRPCAYVLYPLPEACEQVGGPLAGPVEGAEVA